MNTVAVVVAVAVMYYVIVEVIIGKVWSVVPACGVC